MNKLILALMVTIGLTACGSDTAGQKAVKSMLKDPGSAQFDDVASRTINGIYYECGMVNAKNSFGGFTGNVVYAYSDDGQQKTALIQPSSTAPSMETLKEHLGFVAKGMPICLMANTK